ncbi:MAG: spore maturation protein [Bacteroidetes bacterium]|nr:spore maturation protein [Bacteroidota bacterium]
MALSRFWTFIIISSIVFILFNLFAGNIYTLSGVINGKQNDPVLVSEVALSSLKEDTLLYNQLISEKTAEHLGKTYTLANNMIVQVSHGKQAADGLFPTCKNAIIDIWLPIIGYLTFFCGLLHLLSDSDATSGLARLLSPLFNKIFPQLPKGHPAFGFMTMNFAANFLGLDNAATPFGLKAMESLQETNIDKDKASDSQIMFLCLHAAGLTLIPTSIIGYRAAQHAANPSDIMVPCIITSFIGTVAALVFVSIRQRINLVNLTIIGLVTGVSALISMLLFYIQKLDSTTKLSFTGNLSNAVLLIIILSIVGYAFYREKIFIAKNTNLFDSFVHGAKDGFTTGLRILPYMIAMLAVLSLFRNSGLMNILMSGLSTLLGYFNVERQIIDALPVALMRPFSAGGSRGFMLDAMKTYGADSLAGQLSCLFQGAAETTFYVIALYYGSVNIKNTRYTLAIMLLVDLVCVLTAIGVCKMYF